MAISPGYMGYLDIGGTKVWCSDASVSVTKDYLQPDLAQGNYDRIAYAFGTYSVNASVSGPVDSAGSVGSTIAVGANRSGCDDTVNIGTVTLNMGCSGAGGDSAVLTDAKVNTFTLSVSSGDVASYSAEFIAESLDSSDVCAGGGGGVDAITDCGLVTWRDVGGFTSEVQSWEISAANNFEYYWTMGDVTNADGYGGGVYLLPGIRTITGSQTGYECFDPSSIPTNITGFGFTVTLGGHIEVTSEEQSMSSAPFLYSASWQAFCDQDAAIFS